MARKQIRFIVWSPERGWCGHRHASEGAAAKCAAADGDGGRQVYQVDAGAAKRDRRDIDRVRFNGGLYYAA